MAKITVEQPFKIGDIVLVSNNLQFEYITSSELDLVVETNNKLIEKEIKPIVQLVYAPKFTGTAKVLFKYDIKPSKGVIIGWTVKKTGKYSPAQRGLSFRDGYLPPEQASLDCDENDYHKVWVIHLFDAGQRYRKEIFVLEEDITLLKSVEV